MTLNAGRSCGRCQVSSANWILPKCRLVTGTVLCRLPTLSNYRLATANCQLTPYALRLTPIFSHATHTLYDVHFPTTSGLNGHLRRVELRGYRAGSQYSGNPDRVIGCKEYFLI